MDTKSQGKTLKGEVDEAQISKKIGGRIKAAGKERETHKNGDEKFQSGLVQKGGGGGGRRKGTLQMNG